MRIAEFGTLVRALDANDRRAVAVNIATHFDDASDALEPLGPQKLKNVSRPVMTFRLTDAMLALSNSGERT